MENTDDDPDSPISLIIEASGWNLITEFDVTAVVQTAAQLAVSDLLPTNEGNLSILLTDDAAVQELNKRFRGQDKPTNVLSFEDEDSDEYLGDIAIAFETVVREANSDNKSVEDHLCHLVIHGCLHLRGYDHETEEEAEEMESLEIELLGELNIANPYAELELVAETEPKSRSSAQAGPGS